MIAWRQAEAEALLAEIVRSSDDAIFSKTLDAIITSWNPAAERMYGYTAEEAIGRPVSMLLPTERYQDLEMVMAKVSSGVGVQHYNTVRKHKDGHTVQVSLSVSPIRNKLGQIVGASTIARDITAIRQAEDALRGADKLAAMGRMAASIAHEIRNPLEVAKNLAYMLVHDQSPESSHLELLATLEDQLTHMSEISSRTLSFARQGTSPASVSIAAILDETLALMRTNLMAKHVTIDRHFDSSGEVIGYAGPLRQLVVNLIANATDALLSSGGRITLHVADLHHPATGIRGVRLLVGDNGSGIPTAHRSKLFCPFFSTKQDNGTGLGLWVCSGIVTQHGGSIRFRTRSNGTHTGTCFSVFLPKLNVAEMQKTA
jgi:PAS domain S-box-containing protein